MTQQKPEDQVNELTDEQLDNVSAGTPPKETSKPTSPQKAIEIQDYGFGVTMPVTTS
jgi:hypothetical protein